jgi:UDP-N-acetylglucosamine acyltransferase
MKIHPTAIVSREAHLGEGVEIGPYSIIGPDVTIGENTIIGPHVVIEQQTDIGGDCHILQFSSIGADPQDLKFKGEKTRVIIGNHNLIRECVTIHRATSADIGVTMIGDNNLIMAYCHVAHNCMLGNNTVMSSGAMLAGHIVIEDFVIIGGMSGIHQFTRIGRHAFIGGASAVTKDVPPFMTVAGNYAKPHGLNVVGLRRRGFTDDTLKALKQAYKLVYRSSLLLGTALEKIRSEVPDISEVRQFTEFIEKSERGICR